jgi:hypothetical protein
MEMHLLIKEKEIKIKRNRPFVKSNFNIFKTQILI